MITLSLSFGAVAGIVAVGTIIAVVIIMIYQKGKSAGRK